MTEDPKTKAIELIQDKYIPSIGKARSDLKRGQLVQLMMIDVWDAAMKEAESIMMEEPDEIIGLETGWTDFIKDRFRGDR